MRAPIPDAMPPIRESYYRGDYDRVCAYANNLTDPELLLVVAGAFFERHDLNGVEAAVTKANDYLSPSKACTYLKGRLAYYMRDFDSACYHFQQCRKADEISLQQKAILGEVSALEGKGEIEGSQKLLQESKPVFRGCAPDTQISWHHHLAAAACRQGNTKQAEKLYLTSYKTATEQGWGMFLKRTLLQLAKLFSQPDPSRAATYLALLEAIVDGAQDRYLIYLIHRDLGALRPQFHDTSLSLNTQTMVLKKGSTIISLLSKPLVCHFLAGLADQELFQDKESIAAKLWPEEGYNCSTHDLRIYNLAKRTRELIEDNPKQPTLLVSNSQGYRLAVPMEILRGHPKEEQCLSGYYLSQESACQL